MSDVEHDHFWYRALRDLLLRTLATRGLPARPRVLDAGCGSGANLRALADAFSPSYLGGFDLSDEALDLARLKAPSADLYRSDLRRPAIRTDLDLVLSLDVLYIPGIAASLEGLERLVAALAPGGLFVLHLPAYDWLYSRHDVAVHTAERYTAPQVRDLLARLGLTVDVLTYRVTTLFPLVVLSRLPGMLSARRGDREARSDLHTPIPRALDAAFYTALAAENRLIARGASLPWGSSVFAIGRKPK